MSLSQIIITLLLVGWGFSGATMGIGLAKTSLNRALVIHAVAAPVIFSVVAWIYFSCFAYSGPLAAATTFVAIMIAMGFFVVRWPFSTASLCSGAFWDLAAIRPDLGVDVLDRPPDTGMKTDHGSSLGR